MVYLTPPVGDGVGYGQVAINLIRAIQGLGPKVSFNTAEPKVHVSFSQPTMYLGTTKQYRIGYTPWESSEVNPMWIPMMQAMDEIWTTSDYCVEVFENYKVNDKIVKVPHGISSTWEINERYPGNKFVFFHVGGETGRKGGQRVVDAFLELFDGDEEYHLLMKSNGPTIARARPGGVWMGNANEHPQITVIEQYLSDDDLVLLYHNSHCMVYPTNGEGWGMIPWQAIATGMPTICTNATGCADFAEMSVPLDSSPAPGNGIHLGDWVEPSYQDMKDKMKWVVNNYAEIREKTMHSARIIHDTQSWTNIAQQVLEIIGDKVDEKI